MTKRQVSTLLSTHTTKIISRSRQNTTLRHKLRRLSRLTTIHLTHQPTRSHRILTNRIRQATRSNPHTNSSTINKRINNIRTRNRHTITPRRTSLLRHTLVRRNISPLTDHRLTNIPLLLRPNLTTTNTILRTPIISSLSLLNRHKRLLLPHRVHRTLSAAARYSHPPESALCIVKPFATQSTSPLTIT